MFDGTAQWLIPALAGIIINCWQGKGAGTSITDSPDISTISPHFPINP
jgi:hypothetical protein